VTEVNWTLTGTLTLTVAWLAIVWAQGYQKFLEHKSALFKDFRESGAIDGARARIDSRRINPALEGVVKTVIDLRDTAAKGGGELPAIRELLEDDAMAVVRDELQAAMKERSKIDDQYENVVVVARRAHDTAMAHMLFVILTSAVFLFLESPWRTTLTTLFAVLASLSFAFHGWYAFRFGRKREELQRCLA
jgi:hypothetical protein